VKRALAFVALVVGVAYGAWGESAIVPTLAVLAAGAVAVALVAGAVVLARRRRRGAGGARR
jgi:hypothetical protein